MPRLKFYAVEDAKYPRLCEYMAPGDACQLARNALDWAHTELPGRTEVWWNARMSGGEANKIGKLRYEIELGPGTTRLVVLHEVAHVWEMFLTGDTRHGPRLMKLIDHLARWHGRP